MRFVDFRRTGRLTWTALLVALLLVPSCTFVQQSLQVPTREMETTEAAGSAQPGGETPRETPDTIGIVLDPDGDPVAYALVADKELTDSSGVVTGVFDVTGSEWLPVEALGYAPGFFRLEQAQGEYRVFEARLAPMAAVEPLAGEQSGTITLGDAATPRLRATLTLGTSTDALDAFSIVEIDPLDVGPIDAPLSTGEVLQLHHAFALLALDQMGTVMDPAPAAEVTLELSGEGMPDGESSLATFDSQAGLWTIVPDACEAAADNRVTCQLPGFSPLFGLFGEPTLSFENAALRAGRETTSAARASAFQIASAFPRYQASQHDQAYKRALTSIRLFLAWSAARGEPGDPATAANLVEELAQAAEEYARRNPNEAGKLHLTNAAHTAGGLGDEATFQRLQSQATEIANQLARDVLDKADCGRVVEMMHRQEQLDMLAGDETLKQALEDKLKEFWDCDLWVGQILVTMWISEQDPTMYMGPLRSSGGAWQERHTVRMATNPSNYVLTGESVVHVSFPRVSYWLGPLGDRPCPSYVEHFGEPAANRVILEFGGTYDGVTFSLDEPTWEVQSKPMNVVIRTVLTNEGAGQCAVLSDRRAEHDSYYSMLTRHGLYGVPPSAPITIQEMIESSMLSSSGGVEQLRGYEEFVNPMPMSGTFPSKTGVVNWSFLHVKKALPRE